ncbi:TonB-dependent receptor plug domain-containing protein [Aquabacterium sp. OR-4]|uniref:TonB-dependent receptor plug domain-containing protein n=1 Tax=Aquabacterium sp. OR-4 TaxID=2978127 RepID=UPI0021B185CD|nr:TonB-dependent receptor [Aquabacterium sp. OR-4]MDT7833752.1 TonB-dependent receptor [Aquabacterium sp. OR-4]
MPLSSLLVVRSGLAPLSLCCAICSLGPLTARAQQASPDAGADTPSREATSVQRVEIAGRQGATELRRAASVAKQIYDREEIDRHGDTNALDVLRRLPGVNVGSDGPRMRGLGAGYTQILINGDPAPPGFALDQLSPSQIERIEVLRAPTAEQSAQAVAGSINIILKDAPRQSQRDLRLGLVSGLERPMGFANLTLGEAKGPVSLSLPVSLFEWRRENRITLERRAPGRDGLPALSHQQTQQELWGWGYNLGPRLNWKISDDESLSLQGYAQKGYWNNRSDYANQALAGQPLFDDDTDQHGSWENRRGNLVWANRFRADQRIELKAGAQLSKWHFDARNLQDGGALKLHSVGGGADKGLTQAGKYNLLLGEAHSLTAGWDLEARQREEWRSTLDASGQPQLPAYDGQPFSAKVRRTAVYVQDEWEISAQWQLYLGLRQEVIRTESRGSDALLAPVVNTSRVLSPLAHMSYKFDAKGRDMLRASLTRSYKAPGLGAMLARPSINANYLDTTQGNTALQPDRIGNPLLRPELATGLDIAFEHYLANGGLWSVGVFHRQLKDVVRTVTSGPQAVSWATAARFVAQPVNFSSASTSGVELELKGRAADLLPSLLAVMPQAAKALNLRSSINVYRSRVAALPGPDNRLDGQQPWSATLGFDQRVPGLPLVLGGTLGLNPAYDTQLMLDQWQQRSRNTSVDLFGQWIFRQGLSMRLAASAGVQPFGPSNGSTTTLYASGDYSRTERYTRPQFNLSLDLKL